MLSCTPNNGVNMLKFVRLVQKPYGFAAGSYCHRMMFGNVPVFHRVRRTIIKPN